MKSTTIVIRFEDPSAPEHQTTITICQLPSSDFGLFVWPSALLLADYLWQQKQHLRGLRIVELGAGVSLPGILASALGAEVTLTDRENALEVFKNIRHNFRANQVECETMELEWGLFTEEAHRLRARGVDLVVGADCLYESKDFDNFFATAVYLLSLRGRPGPPPSPTQSIRSIPSIILVFQERGAGYSLAKTCRKWGLECSKLSVPQPSPSKILKGKPVQEGAELSLLRFSRSGEEASGANKKWSRVDYPATSQVTGTRRMGQ
mmetsp:Transcript_5456/g.8677  ORF Transcript_5456/g.8677 Transcript_5456/m.8677 type:complete len:264 (+) Transcript_5456:178-969(+)